MDTGSKVFMLAPYTSANVDARSISIGGGWAFYRGWLRVGGNAKGAKALSLIHIFWKFLKRGGILDLELIYLI